MGAGGDRNDGLVGDFVTIHINSHLIVFFWNGFKMSGLSRTDFPWFSRLIKNPNAIYDIQDIRDVYIMIYHNFAGQSERYLSGTPRYPRVNDSTGIEVGDKKKIRDDFWVSVYNNNDNNNNDNQIKQDQMQINNDEKSYFNNITNREWNGTSRNL